MPDWIMDIYNLEIEIIHTRTLHEVILYAVIKYNLPLKDLKNITSTELITIIRLSYFKKNNDAIRYEKLLGLCNDRTIREYLLCLGLSRDVINFLNIDERLELVKNFSNNDEIIEKARFRAQRLELISNHPNRDILVKLYGTDDWKEIAKRNPEPIEYLIFNIDAYNPLNMATRLQMCIPLKYQAHVKEYIRNNIVYYNEVFKRPLDYELLELEVLAPLTHNNIKSKISRLTDIELLHYTDIFLSYDNRDECIEKYALAFHKNTFFYPITRKHSVNSQTAMLDDVRDPNICIIAYGKITSYQSYDIEDLIGAFYAEKNVINFRHPENPNLLFKRNDINSLHSLLSYFPPTKNVNTLRDVIVRGLNQMVGQQENDSKLANLVKSCKMSNNLKQFLYTLFYCGMYMRRWSGPGAPYPMVENDTKIDSVPLDKVSAELMRGNDLIKAMSSKELAIYNSLCICLYRSGNLCRSRDTIKSYWKHVVEGNECIRMASSRFIGTAYHYLVVLYNELIPSFDIKNLDNII